MEALTVQLVDLVELSIETGFRARKEHYLGCERAAISAGAGRVCTPGLHPASNASLTVRVTCPGHAMRCTGTGTTFGAPPR